MRLPAALALTGILVLSAACASAPASTTPQPAAAPATPAAMAAPAPAAVNPVGRWTVALTAQGQAFDFVMDLRHVSGDDYTGSINSQAFPPMPINSAKRSGNAMVIKITAPTGDEATINIVFEGDVLSGEWSMPGDGSRVSGRRIVQ
ncbi:hypothetical protein Strain138_002444 [Pseudogemmatithrix spongiicola]|uniref:Lipoprotein n=1 Tax=Pseudogemmatithrix spongiicola TaxID=3062599 RepID=A0AA49JWE2_9BACT|nr:hypothetical protein Strain138_002444 [Gemmatimonadaceae bacterium 'strain 138']WKW16035.1 hypothetical protein Strain318_002443 [Gemmatimonadaceae bacterium 'strain 318']